MFPEPNEAIVFESFVAASESLLTVTKRADPKTLAEAMSRKDSRQWTIAVDAVLGTGARTPGDHPGATAADLSGHRDSAPLASMA